jgi:hypothetical protein
VDSSRSAIPHRIPAIGTARSVPPLFRPATRLISKLVGTNDHAVDQIGFDDRTAKLRNCCSLIFSNSPSSCVGPHSYPNDSEMRSENRNPAPVDVGRPLIEILRPSSRSERIGAEKGERPPPPPQFLSLTGSATCSDRQASFDEPRALISVSSNIISR